MVAYQNENSHVVQVSIEGRFRTRNTRNLSCATVFLRNAGKHAAVSFKFKLASGFRKVLKARRYPFNVEVNKDLFYVAKKNLQIILKTYTAERPIPWPYVYDTAFSGQSTSQLEINKTGTSILGTNYRDDDKIKSVERILRNSFQSCHVSTFDWEKLWNS